MQVGANVSVPPLLVKEKIGPTVTPQSLLEEEEEAEVATQIPNMANDHVDNDSAYGDDFGCRCGSAKGHFKRRHFNGAESKVRPRFRIVGGRDVKAPVKWIAYLKLRRDNEADFCTGSLINARYVLSAAHCACLDVTTSYVC